MSDTATRKAERALARIRRSDDDRREGRDLINRWAQAKGYAEVDAMAAARGMQWPEMSEIYREHIAETLYRSTVLQKAPSPSMADVARGLGVTATEFKPSPEQMAASRQQLGIEPTPQPAEERGTA